MAQLALEGGHQEITRPSTNKTIQVFIVGGFQSVFVQRLLDFKFVSNWDGKALGAPDLLAWIEAPAFVREISAKDSAPVLHDQSTTSAIPDPMFP